MRLKAIIQYDGTNFSGYQIQPNGRTVQGKLEAVLAKMHKGEHIRVTASGRTDQGVHAVGQTIHFDTSLTIPVANWLKALNTMLPDDIVVKDISEAPPDFHARFDVKEKEYRYFILNTKERDLFKRHYCYHVQVPLQLERMQQAGKFLVGTHDFSSFCAANSNVKGDKIRTITEISIEEDSAQQIIIKVRGTGFLYNMVRIITGTLLEVGFGLRKPEKVEEIITACDRSKAGKTAPPQGLYLWEVDYY
ncbi:tRNA pseudouridine(38-40) synthase TruA [Gracilibacillus caseinilyticus]|uniref:tRNA pseudouridine synthase A n=1 Tax=Gracilibacillus caseinilyticus TaxID=2932256 RepID=A0ABY4F0K0_9BACI|nr:tRNA pseudouridine(38-40) synthase TruA [Gracilibacillus caseinilyticus]UOQ49424.1 tRNA pseudouridine(38-40) synthase TruA [Gracilibacillus caseinilyticus]